MTSQRLNLPSVGQVVKAWRVVRELSGTELSARAGLPKAYISQVEHGKVHQPGDENLALIARALQIPVEYLVTRRLPDKKTQTVGKPARLAPTIGTPGLQRRRAGALASSPMSVTPTPEHETPGQQIDAVLEEESLSKEEISRMGEVLVPHARQLARMMKLMRGIPT